MGRTSRFTLQSSEITPESISQTPSTPTELTSDPRFQAVERTIKQFQCRADALIEVLHVAQEAFGYLSDELMAHVARQLKIPFSQVYGVATFYHFFSLEPRGAHTCVVCTGTACYVKRSAEILVRLEQEFRVKAGKTTEDGGLTLSTIRCLGSCGQAPVMVLDGETVGQCTPDSAVVAVKALQESGRPRPNDEGGVRQEGGGGRTP
ncbi:NADH dehydrogenase (ubiquinone) 24 kDa subunit [Geobacter metallireducens RCH3]|uniref:Bidirectional NAD-reducing hydrogenase, diaphorase subunit n=1 Tax=Geobacter metallireducens (strain ATCC 53774 / DSM 7210 / GS-15) TaxID=269799 RepID=Q39WM5_GEOMG|nr:bidirectional hydrogenase complex protein HoxE [Geobacter metallireducens]ABB31349.1 bidirectional NAD-reducing hydrogenase, diaphorase subunit [Geobacter metallireducens GS-15]EHP85675.1 NADH dehydrogenase (ubiquinone) 24 kDa subunit [Geobacter metallireducens RCH3]